MLELWLSRNVRRPGARPIGMWAAHLGEAEVHAPLEHGAGESYCGVAENDENPFSLERWPSWMAFKRALL
jgi:hypothetical protein